MNSKNANLNQDASINSIDELGVVATKVAIREAERAHFASELHHIYGQHLAAIDANLSVAFALIESASQTDVLTAIGESTRLLRQVTRDKLRQLNCPDLSQTGLKCAIEDVMYDWQKDSNIRIEYTNTIEENGLSKKQLLALYLSVQEGLINCKQHANPTHIELQLFQQKIDTIEQLCLVIRDDGLGLMANTSFGLGLTRIEEYCQLNHGKIELKNNIGSGASLIISLPRAL